MKPLLPENSSFRPDKSSWFPPVLLTSLGILALFLLKNRFPATTDLFLHIYPAKTFILDQLQEGHLPLWNPWVACGEPQWANWQSSVAYPFFWLLAFLGKAQGLVTLCVFHSVIAAMGFYLWGRAQGLKPWVAFLPALSFGGSALFVRCWSYPQHIATLAWIPWIFWALDWAFSTDHRRYRCLLIVFASLQILGGYPIFVLYTWIALIAWFLNCSPRSTQWRWFIGSLTLAALLTAVQWLPFAEFLAYAGRSNWGKDFPYFDGPKDYTTLFSPTALGEPGSNDYQGHNANFVFDLYFGLVPLLFWAIGCSIWNKKGPWRFWQGLSFWGLLWLAGGRLFLWRFIPEKALEFLEPSKALGLFLFAALTAAGGRFQEKLGPRLAVFLGFLWFLDIARVPFQLIHPMPDFYQDPALKEEASRLRALAGNGRIVSLLRGDQMAFTGKDRFEKSVEEPSSYFIANANEAWKIRSADFYESIDVKNAENLQRYFSKDYPYSGDLIDVAGIRLILLPQTLPGPRYRLAGEWKEDSINWNKDASEDLRYAPQARLFPDAPTVLSCLTGTQSGWREKVYLEQGVSGRPLSLSPVARPPSGGVPALARNLSCPGKGYAVFNETFTPGWHAWVDGKPEPILRAYGLFMALPIHGAGIHSIEFHYEPTSFRLGLFVSLLGFGWALALPGIILVRMKAP